MTVTLLQEALLSLKFKNGKKYWTKNGPRKSYNLICKGDELKGI